MIRIFKHLRAKEWLLLSVVVVLVVIQVWIDLKLPDYMSDITQLVQSEGSNVSDILVSGGWMLACAFGSLLTSIVVAAISAKVASSFSGRLRSILFDKVQAFSMEEINYFSTSSLITRSTNDVTQVQMLIIIGAQLLIKAPILAFWAIVKITGKSWQWSVATVVAVLVLVLIIGICMALAVPKFRKLQELTDDLNRVSRENITGIRVVKAYNAEPYQKEKFRKANDELTNTNLFANKVMATVMPSITSIMSGLSLAIYWVGAVIIQQASAADKLTLFSDMVVFSSYAIQVVMAFMMLVMVFILLPRAAVSAKRITEVLDMKTKIKNGSIKDVSSSSVSGELEFRDVSFKYPDADDYVIKDISFTAKKGEVVAFIGSTGCGKSTIVNLIPRFYDVSKGEVLINNINIKEYDEASLRNMLGYVSQKAVLFSGTVASNVAFGDHGNAGINMEDVAKAVKIAQASEFVEKMENGYDGEISQGGSNLSGGQKQRVSISRAIARDPEILIFDDSFSALDYKTDMKLRATLKQEVSGTTMIIVAQRIGTIKNADKIIVLDDGCIVGMGSHEMLMKECDVYKEIAYSQLSKEELE